MMTLRDYQQAAVEAVWQHLRDHDVSSSPCVVIPTGGGKTPVIAEITRQAAESWNGRVLVLAHVKELLEQASDNLSHVPHGVYSAGLKKRDRDSQVLVAQIQSVANRAYELGRFDLILVDEAHLIPVDGEGRYRRFLADMRKVNPAVRLIGFTATPFRMGSGDICGPEHLLSEVCYEVGVKELIVRGFLSRLVSKRARGSISTEGLHVRGGEFVQDEMDALMIDVVSPAVAEVIERTEDRRSVLLFCTGVLHGQEVAAEVQARGHDCGFLCGETSQDERSKLIAAFRSGALKYLANVNVLTTGFDAPNVDAVALLRPTLSPGLYYQMVGRGFRVSEGKPDCLILDFGGNVERHGPVDALKIKNRHRNGLNPLSAVMKACPDCDSLVAGGAAKCPDCGFLFPEPERKKHGVVASGSAVTTLEVETEEIDVMDVTYRVHQKKDAADDHPKTLRVEYTLSLTERISEWVCVEHPQGSFPRRKALQWWGKRCLHPMPATAAAAAEMAEQGLLAWPEKVSLRRTPGEKWPELVGVEVRRGGMPEAAEPAVVNAVLRFLNDVPEGRARVADVLHITEGSVAVAEAAFGAIQAAHGGTWEGTAFALPVHFIHEDDVPF